MPGKTVSQTVSQMDGIVPKKPPERQAAETVEVLIDLDRRKTGPKGTTAVDAREPVGMTSDNYYG